MTTSNLLCAAALAAITSLSGSDGQVAQGGRAPRAAQFNHLALYVRDLPKSAAFYERVLGLERMPDPFGDDAHVWFRLSPRGQLHLIGGAVDLPKQHIDIHLSFSVASVGEFCRMLGKENIRFVDARSREGQVTERPDGIRQVYFQDPDGYWIEVNDDKSDQREAHTPRAHVMVQPIEIIRRLLRPGADIAVFPEA